MSDYDRIAKAITFVADFAEQQPGLEAVADHVGLSPFHLHRLFVSWAGVTPKEFLQALTLQRAKQALEASATLLEAAFDAGLSGPSRLHDLFLAIEQMTPGDYQRHGRALTIHWSMADTPLGPALFAATDRGLCHLGFVDGNGAAELEALEARWGLATLRENAAALAPYTAEIDRRMRGQAPNARLGLLLKGSPLRLKVWQALLAVPEGGLVSYGQLAQLAGEARAIRAVASSVAENPIAYLIPCHRVIRSTGILGEYRWGSGRKQMLIGREGSRSRPAAAAAGA